MFETAVSVDTSGMLEYWTGPKTDFKFPRTVSWEFKTDTDLYEFAKVSISFQNMTNCGSEVSQYLFSYIMNMTNWQ